MSKKLIISIIVIGVIIAVSIWAFLVSAQITKNIADSSLNVDKHSDQINAENLLITETKKGQKYWEVYANSGYYDNQKNIVILKKVKGNFYKENKVILSFDAPVGTYNSKNKEINLKGGSRALTEKDVFISANEIKFAGKNDLIYSTGNVRIQQEDKAMTLSDNAVFNTEFTDLKISGNSKSFVY